MTFFNRDGVLYVSINGIRKSTKLKYSKQNIKKFQSYYEDEEFFHNFNIKTTVPTITITKITAKGITIAIPIGAILLTM